MTEAEKKLFVILMGRAPLPGETVRVRATSSQAGKDEKKPRKRVRKPRQHVQV